MLKRLVWWQKGYGIKHVPISWSSSCKFHHVHRYQIQWFDFDFITDFYHGQSLEFSTISPHLVQVRWLKMGSMLGAHGDLNWHDTLFQFCEEGKKKNDSLWYVYVLNGKLSNNWWKNDRNISDWHFWII